MLEGRSSKHEIAELINVDFEIDKKLKAYYKSCMNVKLMKELGTRPEKKVLKELGGWPVTEGNKWKNEASFKWYDQILKMEEKGFYEESKSIIAYKYESEMGDDGPKVLILDVPFLWGKLEAMNLEDMVNASVLLGAVAEQARIELSDTLQLRKEIVDIINQYTDSSSTIISDVVLLENLNEALGSESNEPLPGHPPNWTIFFRSWLSKYGVTVQEKDKIRLKNINYLKSISTVLTKYQNKPRVLANYLGWFVVDYSLIFLTTKGIGKTHEKLTMAPRWKICIGKSGFSDFDGYFDYSAAMAGSMYMRKHFKFANRNFVLKLIKYIRTAFYDMIKKSKWMDSTTTEHALTKLDRIAQIAAYPEDALNKTFIDGLFDGTIKLIIKKIFL